MLVDALKEQPYQAPVSKHFLASAIVWGFGVCRWDGFPRKDVSECPFRQSLRYFCPLFPLDKWILAKKLRIPTIQPTNHMELKKKEDQSVDALILLRRIE